MAIGTGALINFFGTQDAVTTTGSSTADGAFTSAGTWTNDDDAPAAIFVFKPTFSVAPDTNSVVNLRARMHNIQSTNDEEAPSASFLTHLLWAMPVDDVTTAQYIQTPIVPLLNGYTSQVYEFYIENRAGQTISANWALYVTPVTVGPHA